MYQHILVNGVVKIVQWNNYIISVVRVKNISIVIHILNKNLSVCVPECVTHKVVYQKKKKDKHLEKPGKRFLAKRAY